MITEEKMRRNMRMLRVGAGLTQEQAGNLLGITRQSLYQKETKPFTLTLKTLMRLADAYQCKVTDFFKE